MWIDEEKKGLFNKIVYTLAHHVCRNFNADDHYQTTTA